MATSPDLKTTIKEILPIPDNIAAMQDPDHPDNEVAQTLRDEATTSHALAMADHDEKGLAQETHEGEVKDLGWNEPNFNIANPLVGGLKNDDLWVLLRRFNLQMYHVKELRGAAPGNLDLNIADEEEFSPDKLRANIERLYMTVGIGVLTAGKHMARLRSWRERQRTTAFCVAYFLAWLLDFLAPLLSLTLIILIVYPPSLELLFPPAPLAIVDGKTGGVKKPKAGVLGSTDSATGAPENHKGEAVEAEASGFVNSLASVALASASGKHPMDQAEIDQAGKTDGASTIPDPTAVAVGASNARATAVSSQAPNKHDKAKVPMETAIWNQMRPIMHGLADVSDTWERFGNVLSSTPPFPGQLYRLRLAALVVPLLGASIFITSYMLVKSITFGIGFGFFGDPILTPALQWLNSSFPHWQRILELRNTILKGVPTNAQLTVTLLRIGEANKAPLPPAPRVGAPPPDEAVALNSNHLQASGNDVPLAATEEELAAAAGTNDPGIKHDTAGGDVAASKETSHGKKGSRVLSAVKTSVKGTIEAALGADHVKAKVGSEPSKRRLGVVPNDPERMLTGPVDFKCRFQGKKGHAYISVRATIPCVAFSLDKTIEKQGSLGREVDELNPQWTVAVSEIRELKKLGGLGWKAKLVVGWALDREVADGLEITDRLGNTYVLTAMVLRNELFNRLVAMGGQKWEAW